MLRVNRLTDYATIVLCHMAAQPKTVFSAIALAEQIMIAPPTVSKVLKLLLKQQLVVSKRGAKGGYQLAMPAHCISVARVIVAMEGQLAMTECSLRQGLCEHEDHCALRNNWQKISHAVLDALDGVTLADMVQDMPQPHFVLNRLKPMEQVSGECDVN